MVPFNIASRMHTDGPNKEEQKGEEHADEFCML